MFSIPLSFPSWRIFWEVNRNYGYVHMYVRSPWECIDSVNFIMVLSGMIFFGFTTPKYHPNWDVSTQNNWSLEHLVQRACQFVFFSLNPRAVSPNAMIDLSKTNNQQLTKRFFWAAWMVLETWFWSHNPFSFQDSIPKPRIPTPGPLPSGGNFLRKKKEKNTSFQLGKRVTGDSLSVNL